jgi:hypothetical protein
VKSLSFAEGQLVVRPGVVTRAVGSATVLLNTSSGRYFRLDDIGSRAWSLVTSEPSIQTAYETLLGEYTVDPEQLRQDLTALINDLEARGLVDVRHV